MAKLRGATPEEDELNGWVERGPIEKVSGSPDDGWTIQQANGWTVFLRGEYDVRPKPGDMFTVYGQIGYQFHGQALNDELLWYKTIEQEEAERVAWLAENEAKNKRE